MRLTTIKVLCFISIMGSLLITPLWSQAGHGLGRLQGIVLDADGKPVPGVKISAMIITTQFTNPVLESGAATGSRLLVTRTNKNGRWALTGMGSGHWRITASLPGYLKCTSVEPVTQSNLSGTIRFVLKKISSSKFFEARKAMSQRKWQKACKILKEIWPHMKGSELLVEVDYWMAFSLSKLCDDKRYSNETRIKYAQRGLKYLAHLMTHFPNSKWNDDAKILGLELFYRLTKLGKIEYYKQILLAARSTSPDDMDVKLTALDIMMDVDPAKMLPLLHEIIEKNQDSSTRFKAVLILSRHPGKETRQLLSQIAIQDKDAEVRDLASSFITLWQENAELAKKEEK